jgi:uncharacterized LabA/DUF88 family protein
MSISKFSAQHCVAKYRVGVFVDSLNIFCSTRDRWGKVIDHSKLMKIALAGHKLYRGFVYAVRFNDRFDSWVSAIEAYGFKVKSREPGRKLDGSVEANWDVGIITDIARISPKLDMVVLVSGDGDFADALTACRKDGKIVRVIGVEGFTHHKLKDIADEFTPITEDMLLSH